MYGLDDGNAGIRDFERLQEPGRNGVEAGTDGDEGREGPAKDGNAEVLIDYGEKQTTASLGIPGGSRTDSIRLVTAGETISSNMAGEMAFENDLHLQLFGGGNLHIGGRAVQAYINDGIAYVRVDAPNKTSAQLMRELIAPLQTAQEEAQPSGMPLEPDDLFNKQEIDAINAEIQAEQLGEVEESPERQNEKKGGYPKEPDDSEEFAPLKDYKGNIKIVDQFSPTQYVVELDKPVISGVTKHFTDNLMNRPDRVGLTIDEVQRIVDTSRIVLYQPNNKTLKFMADNGYAVVNIQGKIVTAVPESLRKKYRDYLEGKRHGKES